MKALIFFEVLFHLLTYICTAVVIISVAYLIYVLFVRVDSATPYEIIHLCMITIVSSGCIGISWVARVTAIHDRTRLESSIKKEST